jgi:hypothetical protein
MTDTLNACIKKLGAAIKRPDTNINVEDTNVAVRWDTTNEHPYLAVTYNEDYTDYLERVSQRYPHIAAAFYSALDDLETAIDEALGNN